MRFFRCVSLILVICVLSCALFAVPGFAAENVREYNLLSFSGKYCSEYFGGDAEGDNVYVNFDAGEIPLVFSEFRNYGSSNTSSMALGAGYFLYPSSLLAGDLVDLVYYFPSCSTTLVSSYTYECYLDLQSSSANSNTTAKFSCSFASGALSYMNGVDSIVSYIDRLPLFGDDFVFEEITENGSLVGFHISGVLLYDLKYIYFFRSFEYTKSSASITGTITTTHSSYDDLKITAVTPENTFTVTEFMTSTGQIFASAAGWVADVGAMILEKPILLLYAAVPLCGLGIAVWRRLKYSG